ncbi:hypothetical protein HYH02_011787 [Chlamydomonas schloesseri]|uniref:Uncharacterized protein n=1 Tax=Chlamydomonas schloesseri TaxID=2026947 RepID=A0A835VZY0_9CHLO|nr:hypothetical protein HYH02_011787 [Chlamydomonas schloesseri]|eukprot:KAG2435492.1 hypothetical protein HYH02_011787 [Chlamydomonas schloesseri]
MAVSSVVVPVPGATCRCTDDTAWAMPVKAVLDSWTGTANAQSTAEVSLPTTYYPANTFWAARNETANAWGGYFHMLPTKGGSNRSPTFSQNTASNYTFDVCAGCAQNQIGKGYIAGKVVFRFTSTNGSTSFSVFVQPSAGATVTISAFQVFQSYIAPPSLAPGSFQKFTDYTSPGLPFSYNARSNVTSIVTPLVTIGSASYDIPTSNNPDGVYVAIHFATSGYFCEGTPAYNT